MTWLLNLGPTTRGKQAKHFAGDQNIPLQMMVHSSVRLETTNAFSSPRLPAEKRLEQADTDPVSLQTARTVLRLPRAFPGTPLGSPRPPSLELTFARNPLASFPVLGLGPWAGRAAEAASASVYN